ncbi:MAG: polysaccharide deacetylase family protein [Candidatus Omnitrophica bacterium]|nr:polysaccharide deacetylase family protein [Candidatus Omnitrophota bacterium]MDD5436091.1 polysaccharide deacetylase family protein [Candidatus Omnitrophota bacterium]
MRRRILFIGIVAVAVIAVVSAVIYVETSYTVPILMYHSINNDAGATKLSVSPEDFARQMEFLHKNHYNVVPLEKAVPFIKKKERPPQKTIAITFDDGFRDNYVYAYPVLKRYDIPATIFVVMDWVGTSPKYMDWDEIKEMSDSGLIAIGSHTNEHHWLLDSDEDILKAEVEGSKKTLESRIGRKVNVFCYPMGRFDERSKKAVEAAGYLCAVSTNSGDVSLDDVYGINRVRISRSSGNLFIFWAETTRCYAWFKQFRKVVS